MNVRDDFLLEIYRQAWQQSRLMAQLRAGFIAVFIVAVGAATTPLNNDDSTIQGLTFVALAVLALSGFLLGLRFEYNNDRWTRVQKKIQVHWRDALPVGMSPTDLPGPCERGLSWCPITWIQWVFIPIYFGAMISFAVLGAAFLQA